MSRWTSDSDSDSWQNWQDHDIHYDDIFDAGLPLKNGLLVKTWDGVFRRDIDNDNINGPVVDRSPEELDIMAGHVAVGIIVESKLIGEGRSGGIQYWQYLVNWPDGIVWEDRSDLVMEHDWKKTYYEWLQETAPESF